jgi:hypothetical protein
MENIALGIGIGALLVVYQCVLPRIKALEKEVADLKSQIGSPNADDPNKDKKA